MSLALARLVQGFVLFLNIIDPVEYFANISLRINMAKDYLYITNVSGPPTVHCSRMSYVPATCAAFPRRPDHRMAALCGVWQEFVHRFLPDAHVSGRALCVLAINYVF